MQREVTIDERFCGPPNSANGGYSCGIIAQFADFTPAVMLRKPPPLSKPLMAECAEDSVKLYDGDELVGEARPGELNIDAPASPSYEEAQAATKNYIGLDGKHIFPTCFVCGPIRKAGDGLCLFAGKVAGRDIVAAPWIPDKKLANEDGGVDDKFHWAALDCPGYFSLVDEAIPAVLGKMTAKIQEPVKAGEKCIVIGWPIARNGRKLSCGTAIYKENGQLSAIAEALWINLK